MKYPLWQNCALPGLEKEGIPEDERISLFHLEESLRCLKVSTAGVKKLGDSTTLNHVYRTMMSHNRLKFELPLLLRIDLIKSLEMCYENIAMSIPMKSKILVMLKYLIRKRSLSLNNKWEFKQLKLLWEEAVGIVTRAEKHGPLSSEHLISSHVTCIIEYLHFARRFLTDTRVTNELLSTAMNYLQDIRLPSCLQGIILLVTCLPTNFGNYDKFLPQWVEIWDSIDFNPYWDSCWLTLFTRARKYSRSFDWNSLSPKLFLKVRQLLHLPVACGRLPGGTDFPYSFPAYFVKLMPASSDPSKIALHKLAKLTYFLTITSPRIDGISGADVDKFPLLVKADPINPQSNHSFSEPAVSFPGYNAAAKIHSGAYDIVMFLQSVRIYLFPSNDGIWTVQFASFLSSLVGEISRHVGRSIVYSLCENSKNGSVSAVTIFESALHIETVRFLCGTLTAIFMEGLFGRNNSMMQACCSSLKNLMGIDPRLGDIIIPFLLTALDPAAVSQSHQAPAALQALSVLIKPLLFPSPVILKYLPDLLHLSLPGIDPNDSSKCCITLQMYSVLLAWLPLQQCYVAPSTDNYPPPYLNLTNASHRPEIEISNKDVQSELDALAVAVVPWIQAFLDKILRLLESLEAPKKDQRASALIPIVADCVGYFFQSIVDSSLREKAEEKVIEYFICSTPINAAKTSSKIISSLVENHPSVLPLVLERLFDAEVLSASCSPEKLAFRLRLASGAVRCAQGTFIIPCLHMLQAVLSSQFFFHSEKSVRKASTKLLKDILRGATGVYPIATCPIGDKLSSDGFVFGAPSTVDQSISWNIPNVQVLTAIAALLRSKFVHLLTELRVLLVSLSSSTISDKPDVHAQSVKKTEENILYRLHVLGKVLRGVAEMLGDDAPTDTYPVDDAQSFADLANSFDAYDTNVALSHLTGFRTSLLDLCSAEDKQLFNTLRANSLALLTTLGSTLSTLPATTPFSSLRDSPSIQSAWVKIFKIVCSQRMAFIKNSDSVKKWFRVTKRIYRTTVVKTVQHLMKLHREEYTFAAFSSRNDSSISLVTEVSGIGYWKSHDVSTTFISQRAWLQHAIRLYEFSIQVMQNAVRRTDIAPLCLECYRQLYVLCGHEYDTIRKKALDTFSSMSKYIGAHPVMHIVNHSLFYQLSSPGTLFSTAVGALTLISQSFIMRRITSNWNFNDAFLGTIIAAQGMIAAVSEQDKREILANKLSDSFVKYLSLWAHLPLSREQISSASALIVSILLTLGFEGKPHILVQALNSEASSCGTAATTGLRNECFACYSLLHLIGHMDLIQPAMVWLWAVRTLATAHGEPSQLLALAALNRLTMSVVKSATPIPTDTLNMLRNKLSDKAAASSMLIGLSHCHSKVGDDGAMPQWSRGVASIIHSTHYLNLITPRNLSSIKFEQNVFSRQFYLEHVSMFSHLVVIRAFSELGGVASDIHVSTLSLEGLDLIISACGDLPETSQGETRISNATKAEIFAALMIAVYNSSSVISANIRNEMILHLLTFFKEHTEKISMEYCRDWAEAVYVVTSQTHSKKCSENTSWAAFPLTRIIISEFEQLVAGTGHLSGREDGFVRESKRLLLTRALLLGDICSSLVSPAQLLNDHLPPVAASLIKIMHRAPASALVSNYRSTRNELASILCLIADCFDKAQYDLLFMSQQFSSLIATDCNDDAYADDAIDSSTDYNKKVKEELAKCALETACAWLQGMVLFVPFGRSEALVPGLMTIALQGSGHGELEVAKSSHEAVLALINYVQAKNFRMSCADVKSTTTPDLLAKVLEVLHEFRLHSSWYIRETVHLALGNLMVSNWAALTTHEKQLIKDMFVESFSDLKPEVQHLGRVGLAAYLSFKPAAELATLAEAYIRNSDSLIARGKKRKRLSLVETPDRLYVQTVNMLTCIILSTPYDLPPFLPRLIASLVQHRTITTTLRELVKKVVLEFKRTHQDRWTEFATSFTSDQLADFAGASQISYLT